MDLYNAMDPAQHHLFLKAKSFKEVSSFTDWFAGSISRLRRRCEVASFFAGQKDRKVPVSGWDPHLSLWARAVESKLLGELGSYEPKKIFSNLCWLDREAMAWLRAHGEVRVCDTDKGMGDAAVDTVWLNVYMYIHMYNTAFFLSVSQ